MTSVAYASASAGLMAKGFGFTIITTVGTDEPIDVFVHHSNVFLCF